MRVLTLEEMELVAGGCGRSKGKKSKAKGKKGGKKDDKPDDGTDTPGGKGSRGRYGLPDWYWQWYRTAGQYGAPRGLLG